MQKLKLTRAQQIYPLTEFMRSAGIAVDSYLSKHKLPLRMLDMPDLYVDENLVWRLMENLAWREGLSDLGHRLGTGLDLAQLGNVGEIICSQASLVQGLRTACHLLNVESLGSIFELNSENGYIYFGVRNRYHDERIPPIVELYDLELLRRIVESSTGKFWLPPTINLRMGALPDEFESTKICSGALNFNCSHTAIAIPKRLLSLPMANYDSREFSLPINIQDDPTTADLKFTCEVTLLLEGYLGEKLDIAVAADLMHMSKRSFQRKLTQAGVSFRLIVEEARFDMAKKLLDRTDLNITEIGFELGYTSTNNFSRAFQKWAGVSPTDYRFRTLELAASAEFEEQNTF